jgi:hypothetical protein
MLRFFPALIPSGGLSTEVPAVSERHQELVALISVDYESYLETRWNELHGLHIAFHGSQPSGSHWSTLEATWYCIIHEAVTHVRSVTHSHDSKGNSLR